MKKEKFNQIINVLNKKIQQGKEIIIYDAKELDNLSIKEVRYRVEKARKLHSDMDKIVNSELYHVLGMGGLTVTQQSLFIKKIKELSNIRPYLKTLAALPTVSIGTLPQEAEYHCDALGINLQAKFKR